MSPEQREAWMWGLGTGLAAGGFWGWFITRTIDNTTDRT